MGHPCDPVDRKQTSILGPTFEFKGELTANEDLAIQGQMEAIRHSSNRTIGQQGPTFSGSIEMRSPSE